jgi:hypothetical protein
MISGPYRSYLDRRLPCILQGGALFGVPTFALTIELEIQPLITLIGSRL